MKKLFLVLVLLFTSILNGQTVTNLAFDYPDADIPSVVQFEYRVMTPSNPNNSNYVNLGMLNPVTLTDTPSGHKSFQFQISNLESGNYTVVVRACLNSSCTPDSNSAGYRLIGPPMNLRIKK